MHLLYFSIEIGRVRVWIRICGAQSEPPVNPLIMDFILLQGPNVKTSDENQSLKIYYVINFLVTPSLTVAIPQLWDIHQQQAITKTNQQ